MSSRSAYEDEQSVAKQQDKPGDKGERSGCGGGEKK